MPSSDGCAQTEGHRHTHILGRRWRLLVCGLAAFAELKAKLEKEGWWKRNVAWEAFLLLSVFGLCLGGTYLSYSHPWTASFLIALGMQQAGWLGHDMVHARNSVYCEKMSM